MRVKKVGVLKGTELDLSGSEAVTFATILTNYEPPAEYTTIQLPISIGQGIARRIINLEIPILTSILES